MANNFLVRYIADHLCQAEDFRLIPRPVIRELVNSALDAFSHAVAENAPAHIVFSSDLVQCTDCQQILERSEADVRSQNNAETILCRDCKLIEKALAGSSTI